MDIRISDFINGKFSEIRARMPVQLNGFLDPEASAASFEARLQSSSTAADADGQGRGADGASGTSAGGETAGELSLAAGNNAASLGVKTVIFPNIVRAELEPVSAPEGTALLADTAAPGAEALDGTEWDGNAWVGDQWDGTGAEDAGAIDAAAFDGAGWDASAWDGATLNPVDGGPATARYDGPLISGGYDDPEYAVSATELSQLERNVEYLNKYGDAAVRETIENAIMNASARYGVEDSLIRAVITQESGFSPTCLSSAGAQGLMQLMPETAQYLGIGNVWDIGENVDGGTRLLRDYLVDYSGDLRLALAAYNAGQGAVENYQGVPPYDETRAYVKNVIAYYERYSNDGE